MDHIAPADSQIVVNATPEEVAFGLSELVRQAGGTILERQQTTHHPAIPAEAHACFAAVREYYLCKQRAYAANDLKQVKRIDGPEIYARNGTSLGCHLTEDNDVPDLGGWWVKSELSAREAKASWTSLDNLSFSINEKGMPQNVTVHTSSRTTTKGFSSVLYAWAWPNPSGGTFVFMKAVPKSNNLEACDSCWIVYEWYKQTDGQEEAALVKDVLARLIELDRAGRLKPTTVEPTTAVGCGKDADCKGDRICRDGACVDP